MQSSESKRLASFLAASHHSLLGLLAPGDDRPLTRPGLGAILFVDISGFTGLTERLASRGALGVEELSELINGCFSRLTHLVTEGGGDLLLFAGDAAIVLWPAHTEEELGAAAARAAAAGLKVQAQLRDFEPAPGFFLHLRASVGAGSLTRLLVGGVAGRWQFLLSGEGIHEAVRADSQAQIGEVTTTTRTWRLLEPFCQGRPHRADTVLLTGAEPPSHDSPTGSFGIDRKPIRELVAHLPPPVADRLASGQVQWLSEFRNLTAVFIGLDDLDPGEPTDLPGVQIAVRTIQEALERFGGSVYQLVSDDKGTTLVAAFGLPPRTHSDDTARAVKATLEINESLRGHGIETSIGLATGKIFCGVYGNEKRRQYTLVGATIILAARLAQAAKGRVLAAPHTVDGCRTAPELRFDSLGSMKLKGRTRALEVFVPLLRGHTSEPRLPTACLVGRHEERKILARALDARSEARPFELLTCEGEAGMGKSELVAHLRREAHRRGIRCLLGQADEIQRGVSYFAWRAVFQQALGVDPEAPLEARRRALLDALPEAEWPYAPLLNAILPLELDETDATAELAAEVQADQRHRLMARCIDRVAREAPILLILEDVHWLDAASSALLEKVVFSRPPLLAVATVRTGEELAPETWGTELEPAPRLVLAPLTSGESEELIRQTLEEAEPAPETVVAIRDKAAGNPLFTTELALSLRETGGALEEGNLPSTVQGAVVSRIDSLPPSHQILLKVASVLGIRFDLESLAEVAAPQADTAEDLAAACQALVDRDLLRRGDTADGFRFRTAILQEVAYTSLAFAQRRELHRAIARGLERRHRADLSFVFALLAHHWRRAQEIDRAISYLEKAGSLALERYDNEGAVGYLQEAIELDDRAPESIHRSDRHRASADARGKWQLDLGRAFVNWSRYGPGREHLEKGLALWGLGMPTTPIANCLELVRQIRLQMRLRKKPPAPHPEPEKLLASARAHESLMEIYYVSGADLECLVTILRSLNLAEQAGPSAELARGYATMGSSLATLMGQLPLAHLSDRYYQRALDTAEKVGNPSATAWVSMTLGMSLLSLGNRQEEAEHHLLQAESISRRLGDHRRLDDVTQNLATLSLIRGDLEVCAQQTEALFASARERRDMLCQAEALRRRALLSLLTRDFEDLPENLETLKAIRRTKSPYEAMPQNPDATALDALYHLYRGELEVAVELAIEGLDLFAEFISFYDLFFERSALSRVLLAAWENAEANGNHHTPEAIAARSGARRAVAGLVGHARLFPVAAPMAGLHNGLWHWLGGRARRAERIWERALARSRELPFPVVEALLELEMGRRLRPDDPASRARVARGTATLERLGVHLPLTPPGGGRTLPTSPG